MVPAKRGDDPPITNGGEAEFHENLSNGKPGQASCHTDRSPHLCAHSHEVKQAENPSLPSPSNAFPGLSYLVPVSAGSEKASQQRLKDIQDYIALYPGVVGDIAYTLCQKRIHLSYRAFCVVQTDQGKCLDFTTAATSSVQQKPAPAKGGRKVAFVFTGQGAQWPGMGKALIKHSRSFRDDVREMDRSIRQLKEAPTWSIESMLSQDGDDMTDTIRGAAVSQPLCTAVQLALVNYLSACGIKPDAVIGHSSGEIAAAYAAGALTMREAITCAYLRGYSVDARAPLGKMAAVGMTKDEVHPHIIDGVRVACENSPNNVTLSGDPDAVQQTLHAIKAADSEVFSQALRVNVAYHSRQFPHYP